MNRKLVLIVLLIVTSVCSVSRTDDDSDDDDYDDLNDTTESLQGDNDNNSTIVDSTTSISSSDEDNDKEDEDDEYHRHTYKAKKWIRLLGLLIRISWQQYFPNTNATVNEVIGPKFRRHQLRDLLKRDLKEAYQKKCTKISGNENTYEELMNGTEELKNSSKMWLNYQYETIKNATEAKDLKLIATTFCQKRGELFGYVNKFRTLKDRCSFPREIERETQVRDFLKGITDSACSNGGTDMVSLVSRDGEGRKCIMINMDEIRTCRNKALYALLKRVLKKFIENEYFEFKMDKEDCDEFDAASECFISAVENCVDPIAKNQFISIFAIFREQTTCATFT